MEKKEKKVTKAKEGEWYLIADGYFQNECCGCGLKHKIEVGLAWNEKFEKNPKGKVAIRFLSVKI